MIAILALVPGLACWGLAIFLLARRVSALNVIVNAQAARLDRLERGVADATVLARKRLVAGRSGR